MKYGQKTMLKKIEQIRQEALTLLDNKTKSLDFLSKNRLI